MCMYLSPWPPVCLLSREPLGDLLFASQQSLNESSHRTSDRLQIAFLSTAIVLTLKTSAVS